MTSSQAVNAAATQNILTVKNAELSGAAIAVTATWKGYNADLSGYNTSNAFLPVDLTDPTDGKGYVWNGTAKVEATNQSSLVKYAVGEVTLSWTAGAMDVYAGRSFTVSIVDIMDGGKIRVDHTLSNGVADTAPGTAIAIGTFTVPSAANSTAPSGYVSTLDLNEGGSDAGLNFYYSVSPKQDQNSEAFSAETVYGQLKVSAIEIVAL